MTNRQPKLLEDTYYRVMRIQHNNPCLTQRVLTQNLGVRAGGLNYCLKVLIERSLVKMSNFSHSKNKFSYVYVLTPSGLSEKAAIASRFLQRKMEACVALKAEIKALKAESDINHEKSMQRNKV